MSHFRDHCGVFGIFDPKASSTHAAAMTYLGLFALQHRGQDSAGIAVNSGGRISLMKGKGLVVEAFDDKILSALGGFAAIGHVRYPIGGVVGMEETQPLLIRSNFGQIALAHNGYCTNSDVLRTEMEKQGAIFQSSSDSETMLAILGRECLNSDCIETAILNMMNILEGSYALVIMTDDALIAVRDPHGIRPLCIGKLDESYVVASESCALDSVGAEFIRDLEPGEVLSVRREGISSKIYSPKLRSALCIFEFVYFARPDSCIDGVSVCESRIMAGRKLWDEHPLPNADVVIGAPDSGLLAAMGYSKGGGLPYEQGLLKNRYVGRSFIQPTQSKRELAVSLKFAPLKPAINGKKVVLVDDSVVRGTTTRHVVTLLRKGGAKEVHLRVASPPVFYPCFYGVDTPMQNELTAAVKTKDEFCRMVGADSIEFLSTEGLMYSVRNSSVSHCDACFSGNYCAGLPEGECTKLEKIDPKEKGYLRSETSEKRVRK